MKILIISPRASGVSGIAQHVHSLIKGLIKKNFKVDLVSCENTFHLPFKGVRNTYFSLSASLKVYLNSPYPPKPYDIVHAHNIPSALPMKTSWAKRRILTLHGVFSEQVEELHRWLPSKLMEKLEAKALQWADEATAVSKEAVSYYSKLGFKVHHIPNAIDLEDLPSRGLRIYDKQAIYVGRLSREKGVDLLIEAFKKLPFIHLLILGEGPEEGKLRKMAEGFTNIHFLGPHPREEALTYVKGSDVFIQPSRKEGLSTALMEAMALQVPVIATKVGGNIELVEDGETGLLVEPENALNLMDTIDAAFDSLEFMKELTYRAFKKIVTKYSWKQVLEEYLKLYSE